MGFTVVELYNNIYKALANDDEILNLLGLTPSSDAYSKAIHIQKRSKPQELVNNLPIIAFYALPGKRSSRNYIVYETSFVFDVYTKDDEVDKAQQIAERITYLFDGKLLPMNGVESFEAYWVTGHESATDLANTYCFTVVIEFSISTVYKD